MPIHADILDQLTEVLADLYYDQGSIQAIVITAGLKVQQISIHPRARDTWVSVLEEAEVQNCTQAILDRARREKPKYEPLRLACQTYADWVANGRPGTQSPVLLPDNTYFQLTNPLTKIANRQIQASEWKALHEKCQHISEKLLWIQRHINTNRDPVDIHEDVARLWFRECSQQIDGLVRLDSIASGRVRNTIKRHYQDGNGLARIKECASFLHSILRGVPSTEEFQQQRIQVAESADVLSCEIAQLLTFLDDQLQRSLGELDRDIERMRTIFARPTSPA